jgi:hypothetical protein
MLLPEVVPWGRSYEEYVAMFSLSESDTRKHILGCGDGPASFNAELSRRGGRVVSVDPIYELDGPAIASRFEEAAPQIMRQVSRHSSDWVWTYHRSPEELLHRRRETLNRFLDDYDAGRLAGRYRSASLPTLPFADQTFDLALVSHLLFLYSTQLPEQFHIDSVVELCRVSKEVRIFPLLTLSLERSPHLAAVCDAVSARGWSPRITRVAYEFQRGGNEMLLIERP